MSSVKVRVPVMIKRDGLTPDWVHYVKDLELDSPPVVGDVLMIEGHKGLELLAVGQGSTQWGPSDESVVITVRVDKRFFMPDGRLLVEALLPWNLAQREDDDETTTMDELWGRFKWDEISAALHYAGYKQDDQP